MKATIYGNRLPRGTQVKKKMFGNQCSEVCKLVAKVHHKHVIRRNKPEGFEVPSSYNITFGLSMPTNPAKPVCYSQQQDTWPSLSLSLSLFIIFPSLISICLFFYSFLAEYGFRINSESITFAGNPLIVDLIYC